MIISTQNKLIKFHEIAAYVPLVSSVSALIKVIALRKFNNEGSIYVKFVENQPAWKRVAECIPIIGNIILIADRWLHHKIQENHEVPAHCKTAPVCKPEEQKPNVVIEVIPDFPACKRLPLNPQEMQALNHEIWKEIVLKQQNPDHVFNALVEEMKNDPDCLFAIVNSILEAQNRGRDLQEQLEKYTKIRRELVRKIDLEKVIQDPSKLNYNQIDAEFKKDPEFLLEAFEKNVLVFPYLPEEIQNDLNVFESTLKRIDRENDFLMKSFDNCLKRNWQVFRLQKELMLLMCERFPKFVHSLIPNLLNDQNFALTLVGRDYHTFHEFLYSKTTLLNDVNFLKLAIFKCAELETDLIIPLTENISLENFNNIYNDHQFLFELIMKIKTTEQLRVIENWLNRAHLELGFFRAFPQDINQKLQERRDQLTQA